MTAWNEAALLLVGHGSSRLASGREATERLATTIRRQGLFAEVQECFWKEPPFLSLDLVKADLVYVVPNFAGEGVFTRRLIPEKLGLTGVVTDRAGRRLIYTDPVGCHPRIPQLLRRRAIQLCAAHGIRPAATALLIVGHGSRQPGRVSSTPEAVAASIRAGGGFAEVATAYIEQAPRVADWQELVAAPRVIAAPLLISEGMHTSQDLPPLFGLTTPAGGPTEVDGRTTWLMGGIGRDPEVVEMILDQVRSAEAAAALTAAGL
jgi:sirohydrochlorin cobaltochelatase